MDIHGFYNWLPMLPFISRVPLDKLLKLSNSISSSVKWVNNITYLSWELNVLIHIECLEQRLAHNKHSGVSNYY